MSAEVIISIVWMIPIFFALLARIVWWIFYSQIDDEFLPNKHEEKIVCITIWPLMIVVLIIGAPVLGCILLLELICKKIENYRKLRCSQKNSLPVTK